jgi:hypothetical protein
MKGNIVLGGLLGIALGAGVVFGLAHAVPSEPPAVEAPVQTETPAAQEQVSTAVEVPASSDASRPSGAEVRHRPLRPGSERIGRLLRS